MGKGCEGSGEDWGLCTTGVDEVGSSSDEAGGGSKGGEGGEDVGEEEELGGWRDSVAGGGASLRRSSRKTQRRVSMVGGFAVLREKARGVPAVPKAPRKARSAFRWVHCHARLP